MNIQQFSVKKPGTRVSRPAPDSGSEAIYQLGVRHGREQAWDDAYRTAYSRGYADAMAGKLPVYAPDITPQMANEDEHEREDE